MTLQSAVTEVKGVGQAIAEKLRILGVKTVEDLLYYFPYRYEDFSHVVKIADIQPGNITIRAEVESVTGRHIRRGMHVTEAVLNDGSAKTRAVWFNQRYRADQLTKGAPYFFSGTYGLQRNRYVLQNPATELANSKGVSTARIVPIYHETAGLKSHQIRKVLRELMPLMSVLPETLPPTLVQKQQLLDINTTLKNIHFPESGDTLVLAKERISFEELFAMLLASVLNRQEVAKVKGWQIPVNKQAAQDFVARLPFALTNAQRMAAWEILQDFAAKLKKQFWP